jgi:hypothetical protein
MAAITQGVLLVVCVLLPAGTGSGRERNWISYLLISSDPGSLKSKVILQVWILRIGWRCFTGLAVGSVSKIEMWK